MARTRRQSAKLSRRELLRKAREKRRSKRPPIKDPPEKAKASKPVLRSSSEFLNGNYIINMKNLVEGLQKCSSCNEGPLLLEDMRRSPSREGLGAVIYVPCNNCGNENQVKAYETHRTGSRGPESTSLHTNAALAMLHTGQGHTSLNATLSLLGVGSISADTLKKHERNVGQAVEAVCEASCERWRDKEKEVAEEVDAEGNSLISVSYDGAWQKRGKGRDSTTGFGTVIGQNTGKVLDYGVKATKCRTCDAHEDPPPHNCRRNFRGSSKSMEPEIAVQCFNQATTHGLKYKEYIGDEDATTESHVRNRVKYDTVKRTDRNHASRTLGSRLYNLQKSVKGLTAGVINYILRLFTYCVSQNQGKPNNIKKVLKVLVDHAFGEHASCDEKWCSGVKDPKAHKYKDLPGGKPLGGDNLRAAIESAMKPFQTEEWYKKLSNCGSSQSNECVNEIVGTKAPKIRHYGSSDSLNFRVASGIAQFNDGVNYLNKAQEVIGLKENGVSSSFVVDTDKKRKRDQQRMKTSKHKRRRRELKKLKTRRKEKLERKEGSTYETGIGVTPKGQDITRGMVSGLLASVTDNELGEISSYIDSSKEQNDISTSADEGDREYNCFCFDIETTGLKRDSEIVQIACVPVNDEQLRSFNAYAVPDGEISSSASKVNKLTTGFREGKKVLLKENKTVTSEGSELTMKNFVQFFEEQHSARPGSKLVLIAHNGDTFDFPVLINSLKRYSLIARMKSLNVLFLDSLKVIRDLDSSYKEKKNLNKKV